MRVKRKLHRICYGLYPFSLMDNIKRKEWLFLHGCIQKWVNHIYLSLFFMLFCICITVIFYVFHFSVI